jgi:enamine deaminase RidA (YjgF/YER057c/UK114 family)
MMTSRDPETIHQPLATYSHQVELEGPQRWLVLSGQIGMDADGVLPEDPIGQFKIALSNIEHNLKAARMRKRDLVKLTTYLVGEVDARRRRELLDLWLEGHKPAMTLLYVAALASKNIKVEVEALACVDA